MFGLDSPLNYEAIGSHQYTFEIESYNFMGNGGSSFLNFSYSVPDSS